MADQQGVAVAKTISPSHQHRREKAFFCTLSAEFMVDTTLPIELRALIAVMYSIAVEQVAQEHRGLEMLGTGEFFDLECSYELLIEKTGWTTKKIARLTQSSAGIITMTGSPRTGFRWRVNLGMRSYRAKVEGVVAGSLFARKLTPPIPKKRQVQLHLDVLASDTEGKTVSLDSDSEGKVVSLASNTEGKADSLVSDTEGKVVSLDSDLEGKAASLASDTEAKIHIAKVSIKKDNNNNGDVVEIPEAMLDDLLLLYRKNDPNAHRTSIPFTVSMNALLDEIQGFRKCDRQTAVQLLGQIANISDFRARSFANPIGYIRANLAKILSLSLTVTRPESAGDAFYALDLNVRRELILAIRDGMATNQWCRERKISPGARQYAHRLIGRNQGLAGRVEEWRLEELQDDHSDA
jgi:hypothetical protein